MRYTKTHWKSSHLKSLLSALCQIVFDDHIVRQYLVPTLMSVSVRRSLYLVEMFLQ